MTIDELNKKVQDFDGVAVEWLEFEKEIHKDIDDNFGEDEVEKIMFLNILEPVSMICEGIRYEVERFKNATSAEREEMLNDETGDALKQVLEYMGIDYK